MRDNLSASERVRGEGFIQPEKRFLLMEPPANPAILADEIVAREATRGRRRRLAKMNGMLGAPGKGRGPYPLDPLVDDRQVRAFDLRASGLSVRRIALHLRIDRATAQLAITMEGLRRTHERRDERRESIEVSIGAYDRTLSRLDLQAQKIQQQITDECVRVDAGGSKASLNHNALFKLRMSLVAVERTRLTARSRLDSLLGLSGPVLITQERSAATNPVTEMIERMTPQERRYIREEAARIRRDRDAEQMRLANGPDLE